MIYHGNSYGAYGILTDFASRLVSTLPLPLCRCCFAVPLCRCDVPLQAQFGNGSYGRTAAGTATAQRNFYRDDV